MEKSRKPKIRFKGFNDDWEQRKLEDLLESVQIKNSDGHYSQDDILACSLGTELNKKTIFYGLRSTKESVKSYRIVNINDVIYTKSPIKGYPNGIVRTSKIVDGIVPSLYCVYQKKRDISMAIDTRFIQSYLEDKNRLDYYLFPLVNVGARNNVNITDKEFLKGIIKIPICIEEQIQIVEMLEKVNHLITLHQRKLDKFVNVKKSMLEKMFPKQGSKVPNIRFAGFADDWEQRKLGEIAKTTIGEFVIKTKQDDNYPYPVFNGGSSNTGFYNEFNNEGNKILVSARGANAGFVNIVKTRYWAGNSCYSIDLLDKNEFDTDFIFQEMKRNQERFTENQQAANIPSVSKADVEKFVVDVPSYAEQLKIGEYFANLDNLITLHQRKLEKLKNIKKSMLEKMFI